MSAPGKPTLCLALMHDYAARDFTDSGVLDELATHFNLSFVSTKRLTLDLARYGEVVHYPEPTGVRLRIAQLARALWHMVDKSKFELNRRHALARATFGLGERLTKAVHYLYASGLARPVAFLTRLYLRATAPQVLSAGDLPDAMLIYTPVQSYFADDLIRECRRLGLRCLALTNNWDNLNTKSFFEVPPYLGVWGQQGFLIARLMHLIPAHRLFVIGAPRFEIYRRLRPTKAEARRRLGLSPEARILLFCGAGVSFEETTLLEELEAAIGDHRLPSALRIVYKPHPLRFARAAERPFDMAGARYIVPAPSAERKLTELELYPYLLAAADGIISPFSTMVIEGARQGLPALCLAYQDPGHSNHDWNRVAFNLHLYLIRHGEWAAVCDNRREFIEKVKALLHLCNKPKIADLARGDAEMAARFGEEPVAERIVRAIESIVAGKDADDSYRLSLQP